MSIRKPPSEPRLGEWRELRRLESRLAAPRQEAKGGRKVTLAGLRELAVAASAMNLERLHD
jgi:hypothetical protein